jgi:hypothetical protein
MVSKTDIASLCLVVILALKTFIGMDYAKLGGVSRGSFNMKQTELYAQLSAKKDSKTLTEKQFKEATLQAIHCQRCMTDAVTILQNKNFNPSKDKKTVLNYIITAKGYAENMKKLGVPNDRELADIQAIEKALYGM